MNFSVLQINFGFWVFWVSLGIQGSTLVTGTFRDFVAGPEAQYGPLAKEPVPEHLKPVVTCKLGKPHPVYSECRCGEYPVRVPKSEIQPENLGEYYVRTKTTYRGSKHIYYYCLFCSLCEDGVRTKTNCTQRDDTQCMTGVCRDPTHIYDKGRRGCFPDPHRVTTSESLTTTGDINVNGPNFVAEPEKNGVKVIPNSAGGDLSKSGGQTMTSSLILRENYLIVLGCFIAIGMTIVLIVNIYVCIYFCKRKGRLYDQERESMIQKVPSSSSITTV